MKYFLLAFFVFFLGGSLYVFLRMWFYLSLPASFKPVYSLLCVLLFLSFPLAMFLRNSEWTHLVRPLFVVGSTFLLFLFYSLLLFALLDGLRFLQQQFALFSPAVWQGIGKLSIWVIPILFLALFSWGHYQFRHPVVKEIDIQVNKQAKDKKSLRVVAFSDVHLGYGIGKKRVEQLVEQVNALQPDLVLIGGDLIDNSLKPLYAENMQESLTKLRAPLGVYMATGNHEYISGIEASREFIQATGIVLLENQYRVLDGEVAVVVAQKDPSSKDSNSFSTLLEGDSTHLPILAISHQPTAEAIDSAVEAGADLLFCGHTHFGQVWPFTLLVKAMYHPGYGLLEKEGTHVYVSSGWGLWGPPFRLGTQSELLQFNLHFR